MLRVVTANGITQAVHLACIAQLVERLTSNEKVDGSIPSVGSPRPRPWQSLIACGSGVLVSYVRMAQSGSVPP